MVRSDSKARLKLATVCACTPCHNNNCEDDENDDDDDDDVHSHDDYYEEVWL